MKKERYINDVLKNLNASPKIKERIREDLGSRIDDGLENDPFFDVIEVVGEPKEVAKELSENFELEDITHIEVSPFGLRSTKSFEYKSEASLFGAPLVHINTGGRYSNRVAKGVIAIGDVSFGLLSLGGVSFGLLSFGGVGIGLLGIGGVGIGLLGIGGVGIGYLAIGAVAIGVSYIGAVGYGIKSVLGAISSFLS